MTDGIHTFMDCPDHYEFDCLGVVCMACQNKLSGFLLCDKCIDNHQCPRGYQR
jgi:hypothetical protein